MIQWAALIHIREPGYDQNRFRQFLVATHLEDFIEDRHILFLSYSAHKHIDRQMAQQNVVGNYKIPSKCTA